jgi:phospholipid/cholesterol/gamma-HCH transport system substrate-binding protein
VLAAILGAIALIYTKPTLFSSYHDARLMFRTAAGLGVVGRNVEVAGTPVGIIANVQRVGNAAEVTVALDAGIVVHTDATAELRPHLPFEGTAYVDLQPGSPTAPRLGNRVLPLSHTSVYVPVFHALSAFTPPTRAAVQADTAALSAALAGAGGTGIRNTLAAAPQLTATLAPAATAAAGPHHTELASAVSGLADTFRAFDEHQRSLEPLLAHASTTLAALGTAGTRPLSTSIAALPATLTALVSGSDALDGIVTRLRPLAGEFAPALAVLAPTLRQTDPLLAAAPPVLHHTPELLDRLTGALRAGAGGASPTVALLGSLSPSLDLLQSSLLPALLAPTANLHIPAYLSFINLFEGGGGASAPFQTPAQASLPGQTGVGHFMRFGASFFTGLGAPLPPCTLLASVSPTLASEFSAEGICQS